MRHVLRDLAKFRPAEWFDRPHVSILAYDPLSAVLQLQGDNGLVFASSACTKLMRRFGLEQEFITPHCPQQNGIPLGTLAHAMPHRAADGAIDLIVKRAVRPSSLL